MHGVYEMKIPPRTLELWPPAQVVYRLPTDMTDDYNYGHCNISNNIS